MPTDNDITFGMVWECRRGISQTIYHQVDKLVQGILLDIPLWWQPIHYKSSEMMTGGIGPSVV